MSITPARSYNVVLEPDPDGGYVASVPALAGCYSQGRDAARAFAAVGYEPVRQRGNHIRLRHRDGERPPLTVPGHRELTSGLLHRLVRDSGMIVEDSSPRCRRASSAMPDPYAVANWTVGGRAWHFERPLRRSTPQAVAAPRAA